MSDEECAFKKIDVLATELANPAMQPPIGALRLRLTERHRSRRLRLIAKPLGAVKHLEILGIKSLVD